MALAQAGWWPIDRSIWLRHSDIANSRRSDYPLGRGGGGSLLRSLARPVYFRWLDGGEVKVDFAASPRGHDSAWNAHNLSEVCAIISSL